MDGDGCRKRLTLDSASTGRSSTMNFYSASSLPATPFMHMSLSPAESPRASSPVLRPSDRFQFATAPASPHHQFAQDAAAARFAAAPDLRSRSYQQMSAPPAVLSEAPRAAAAVSSTAVTEALLELEVQQRMQQQQQQLQQQQQQQQHLDATDAMLRMSPWESGQASVHGAPDAMSGDMSGTAAAAAAAAATAADYMNPWLSQPQLYQEQQMLQHQQQLLSSGAAQQLPPQYSTMHTTAAATASAASGSDPVRTATAATITTAASAVTTAAAVVNISAVAAATAATSGTVRTSHKLSPHSGVEFAAMRQIALEDGTSILCSFDLCIACWRWWGVACCLFLLVHFVVPNSSVRITYLYNRRGR